MGQGILNRIAEAVGTPTYVYDVPAIRRQYQALDRALAPWPHRICYSVKANGNLAVLGALRRMGAGADIVSGGELARVLRAGFAAGDVVFSGVGKTAGEIEAAVGTGIGLINVESAGELEIVARAAEAQGRTAAVGIRVNPDVTTRTHPYTQTGERGMKFGVPIDEVVPLANWAAARHSLVLRCVGMHVGSQIAEAGPYRQGAAKLLDLIGALRGAGVRTLESVDVGGGLGISYGGEESLLPEAFAEAVGILPQTTGLTLLTEPGRFLVGNAGYLLTRVLYRKRNGGREMVVVDAGMNDLIRPSLYGAHHDIRVVEAKGLAEGPPEAGLVGTVDVVGPLCETGDFLGVNRALPGAGPGSLLAVGGAGAYGFCMSSQYNARPRAAEVLMDGERFAVVRQRETVDDLMRGERTEPRWSES